MGTVSNSPHISGIMAARNAAPFVGAAIESALQQTYANFELLVVDDASTDETGEIVAGYAKRDARVRLIRQETWGGPCAARNLALREARGEWIAVLDSDDLWHPNRLERQIALIEKNPAACLITSDYQYVNEEGRSLGVVRGSWPEWWLRWQLLFGNAIGGHSQVLYRRETALACGGYREGRKTAEDYQLWIDLIGRGGIAYVDEVLMDCRRHDKSEITLHRNLQMKQVREISDRAMLTLSGKAWVRERMARMRNFWSENFPACEGSLPQMARDLRNLEDAFWRRYPELATSENRKELAGHIRGYWKRLASHFWHTGNREKALSAWYLVFTPRLGRRLKRRFVSKPPTVEPNPARSFAGHSKSQASI